MKRLLELKWENLFANVVKAKRALQMLEKVKRASNLFSMKEVIMV